MTDHAENPDQRDAYEKHVEKMLEADDAVKAAAQEALSQMDPDEDMLKEAILDRREQATQVGLILLSWYRSGGRVELQRAPTLSVVEEPEEPVDVAESEPEPEPSLGAAVIREPEKAKPADLSKLVAWAAGETDSSRELVKTLLEDVNPRKVQDLNDYNTAVSVLDRYSQNMVQFEDLPDRNIRKAVLGLMSSQSRHLQDETGPRLNHPFMSNVLDRVFRSLTRYSKKYRPGFVFGLSRNHEPEFGSDWVEEQEYWAGVLRDFVDPNKSATRTSGESVQKLNPEKSLNRLRKAVSVNNPDRKKVCAAAVECLDAGVSTTDPRILKDLYPHLRLLTREKRLKGLRKSIRDYKKELEAEGQEAENDNSQVPEDWPYWELTRGKRLLVLGGDKRETAQERLQSAFDFESADWESGLNHNRIKSAARKIEHGFYDVVILLARFAGHDIDDAVRGPCKDTGTHFIIIERGYGVSRVKYHMEQYFQGKTDS